MAGKRYEPPRLESEAVFKEALLACNIYQYLHPDNGCIVKLSELQCNIRLYDPWLCITGPPIEGAS